MPEPMGTNPQGSPTQTMQTAAQEAAKFLASQPQADQGANVETQQAPPSQQAQPTEGQADLFEIVHEGQKRQLTREEAVKLAQMGFDYTQKMQRLALLRNMPPEQVDQLSQQAIALKQLQDFASQNPDFVEYLNSYKPGWKAGQGNQGAVQGQSPQGPSPDLAQLQQRLWQIEAQNVERQLEEALRTLPQKIADRFKREGVEISPEELAKEIRSEEILETAHHYKLPLEKIEDAYFIRYGPRIAQKAVQGYLKAKTAQQAGPKVPGPGGAPATKAQEVKTFDQAAKAALAYLRAAEEQSNY